MIFSKSFKSKFGFISTTSLAVLSALLSSPQAQAMDTPGDEEKFSQLCKVAVAENSAEDNYINGIMCGADYAGAKHYFQLAANAGHAKALCQLGLMYYEGEGVSRSYRKAFVSFMSAAKMGYAQAQYRVGNLYYNGKGVEQDHNVASHFYTLAARQGLVAAERMFEIMEDQDGDDESS